MSSAQIKSVDAALNIHYGPQLSGRVWNRHIHAFKRSSMVRSSAPASRLNFIISFLNSESVSVECDPPQSTEMWQTRWWISSLWPEVAQLSPHQLEWKSTQRDRAAFSPPATQSTGTQFIQACSHLAKRGQAWYQEYQGKLFQWLVPAR